MKRSQQGSIKAWVLLFVVLAGGGIALLVGVGCSIKANACPFRTVPKQTFTDGATLYLVNCAACHGRKGEGISAPSLIAGEGALLTGETLFAKISNGKPLAGMPKFRRSLSALQIKAVAAFVESLRSPGSSPQPSSQPSPHPSSHPSSHPSPKRTHA